MANGKVQFLNCEQLKRVMLLCWKARNFGARHPIALLVTGSVGGGKTQTVTSFVSDLNQKSNRKVNLWTWILATVDPTDIGGTQMPNADRTKMKYLVPEELPFDNDDVGVILADEADRGTEEAQNALCQVMLSGSIHGHTLSKNAFFVLTMNGVSDIFTTPLSEAVRTRSMSVFLSAHAEGFQDRWQEWAEDQNVTPEMRGFMKFRPDLMKIKEEFEELAIDHPRTRVMADQIIQAAAVADFETKDILFTCIAGLVGKATAREFIAYKEMCDKCPDPDSIIANPEKARLPDEAHVGYAIGMALISRIAKSKKKEAQAVVKYAIRMKEELTAFILRKLADKCPAIVLTPEYQKWTKTNQKIIQ